MEEGKLSMSSRIRLVLALHDHQPIGNFDGVFEAAFQDSYWPFLDVLEKYPEIPVSLHTSGSLGSGTGLGTIVRRRHHGRGHRVHDSRRLPFPLCGVARRGAVRLLPFR